MTPSEALAAALHREDTTGRAIHEDWYSMQVPSYGPEQCQACPAEAAKLLFALSQSGWSLVRTEGLEGTEARCADLGGALVAAILATPNSTGFNLRASRYGTGLPHGRATYEWSGTGPDARTSVISAKDHDVLALLDTALTAALQEGADRG